MKREQLTAAFSGIHISEEMRARVLRKALEANRSVRRRRFAPRLMAAAAACVAVAGCLALTLQFGRNGSEGTLPYGDGPALVSGEQPGSTPSQHAVAEALLNVNRLSPETVISADMDVQYRNIAEMSEEERAAVLQRFEKESGRSYEAFAAVASDVFASAGFHTILAPGGNDGDYALHDYVFTFRTGGGEATVALCAFEEPLRDCLFPTEDEPALSEIGGVRLAVYECNGAYYTAFSHNGMYYDIATERVSLDELAALLTAIVQ